jgi:hypothetical protein
VYYQPLLLMPFSDVLVPVLNEACMARVRLLWRPGSVGSKIEVLTDGCDRPAIDHRAVSRVGAAADRSLRECEWSCYGERGRENDCLEFHGSIPLLRKQNEDGRHWLPT